MNLNFDFSHLFALDRDLPHCALVEYAPSKTMATNRLHGPHETSDRPSQTRHGPPSMYFFVHADAGRLWYFIIRLQWASSSEMRTDQGERGAETEMRERKCETGEITYHLPFKAANIDANWYLRIKNVRF